MKAVTLVVFDGETFKKKRSKARPGIKESRVVEDHFEMNVEKNVRWQVHQDSSTSFFYNCITHEDSFHQLLILCSGRRTNSFLPIT